MGRAARKAGASASPERGATKTRSRTLVPQGHKYMENGFNMLLVGPHGTGKTESVMQIAEELGMKIKIFNCATLDPYTDLIGVPVPGQDDQGRDELKMVRPGTLQDAEVIFFDEINRAPIATRNAVFEIIQFRSLNGEELPNLRCCWAAMNPAGDDYDVEEIDPALIDRFDAYHHFKPKLSIPYMTKHMQKDTALALREWWEGHNQEKRGPESYISPRRLTKLGVLFETMGSRAVKQALPLGGQYDSGKLIALLEAAKKGELQKELKNQEANDLRSGGAGLQKALKTRAAMAKESEGLIEYLEKNPDDLDTHQKITDLLSSGVGTKRLLRDYADIMEALPKRNIEAIFSGMKWNKRNQISNMFYSQRYRGVQVLDLDTHPKLREAMQNCSIDTYGL